MLNQKNVKIVDSLCLKPFLQKTNKKPKKTVSLEMKQKFRVISRGYQKLTSEAQNRIEYNNNKL